MFKKRKTDVVVICAILALAALSGCSNADYWQRADVREAIRFNSEHSQQMLNTDIESCEKIQKKKDAAYDSFNTCMEAKGWEQIKHLSEPDRDVATKAYIHNEKKQNEGFYSDQNVNTYLDF